MTDRGAVARRIASICVTTVLVASIVIAGLMVLPTLLGYERYVIVSGSMEPTIPVGSVVYDEVVPVGDLEVGDVITFVPPEEFGIKDPVTHRIVRITAAAEGSGQPEGTPVFTTQGDANPDPDAWDMVLAGPDQARVVHHIPYVGYVYIALQKPWVRLLLIVLPSLGLIVFILVTLWRVSGDAVRAEKQATPTPAGEGEDDERVEAVP